jgi:hypothetical protein
MASAPVRGIQHYIRLAKSMLIHLTQSKDTAPELTQLLKHIRHHRIRFRRTGNHKSFVLDNNISLDGLTRRLKRAFWHSSTAPKTRQGETRVNGSANTDGCYFNGISWHHGRRVHQDFARIVKCITEQVTMKKDGSLQIRSMDPCAFRIFMRLLGKKIIPIICEMAIFDEHIRVATAVDCIAYDTVRNRLIAIELKTGHETQRNYSAHNGRSKLLHPLDQVPDSPLNRAAIQLVVSLLMIYRRYGVKIHDAMVVRPLSMSGIVQFYQLPPWIQLPGYQSLIYNKMKQGIGSSQESRFLKMPATKRKREEMEADEKRQRVIEKSIDPKSTVFWIPDSTQESKEEPTDSDSESEMEVVVDSESESGAETKFTEEMERIADDLFGSDSDSDYIPPEIASSSESPSPPVSPSLPPIIDLDWDTTERELLDYIQGQDGQGQEIRQGIDRNVRPDSDPDPPFPWASRIHG